MLSDVYIKMILVVQKNHLGGQILYRSPDPFKETASK